MVGWGWETERRRGGDLRRFDTPQHRFYGGIDLHARTMDLCVLNQAGEIRLHRNMKTSPETLLKAIAPYREDLVVCVEGIFTWSWLADLCAQAGMPVVLGHALDMKAIHGGQAKHDTIDAHKIAVLRRGGMLPQADVYPAAMRATRDVRRRRRPLMRKRAALLAHGHKTTRQYHLPEIGKQLADKANRTGVAEHFPDPAVHKSIAVDLALLGHYDRLLTDLELSIVQTAKEDEAQTFSRRRSIPGVGTLLARVRLDERHDIQRLPRVQEFVSSCRLVKCAKEAAGTRSGTSGTKIGHASRKGAFSEAAGLCLRNNPAGQTYLARVERRHGKGNAFTGLAHKVARAVSYMFKRDTAFDLDPCLHEERRGASEPAAYLDAQGISLAMRCWERQDTASGNAEEHRGLVAPIPARCLDTRSGSSQNADGRAGWTGAAPHPNLTLTGERGPFSPLFEEDGTRAPRGF
jgi:transposase